MKMQASRISVVDVADRSDHSPREFSLSGETSEWLFSTKFWAGLNARCGTMFDQYEEDEVEVLVVEAVMRALDERVESLRSVDSPEIIFARGWTADHMPMIVKISRETLLNELIMFRTFLFAAVEKKLSLSFSL